MKFEAKSRKNIGFEEFGISILCKILKNIKKNTFEISIGE
jgi:hypothetical protein